MAAAAGSTRLCHRSRSCTSPIPTVLAAVLPPPLDAAARAAGARPGHRDPPRASVRSHARGAGRLLRRRRRATKAQLGEYPLLIPIDLEPAVAISRERFGEPKKLADIEISPRRRPRRRRHHPQRRDVHRDRRRRRRGAARAGAVPGRQWWFKFMPAVTGQRLRRRPAARAGRPGPHATSRWSGSTASSCCATCRPARSSTCPCSRSSRSVGPSARPPTSPRIVGPVDPVAFEPFAYSRYDWAADVKPARLPRAGARERGPVRARSGGPCRRCPPTARRSERPAGSRSDRSGVSGRATPGRTWAWRRRRRARRGRSRRGRRR